MSASTVFRRHWRNAGEEPFAQALQAARGAGGVAIEGWKPIGPRGFGAGAGLLDAVGGGDQVRVVFQGPGDQIAQGGVGENLAPCLVAE